jgi:hypothetical protein
MQANSSGLFTEKQTGVSKGGKPLLTFSRKMSVWNTPTLAQNNLYASEP